MSKAQKSNRENKKPKADKNRIKKVSAYKAAQTRGKPASRGSDSLNLLIPSVWRIGTSQAGIRR